MTGTSPPVVLVICGDAGGASAIAPVAKLLIDQQRADARLFAYRQAKDVWAAHGLVFQVLEEDMSSDDADALLRSTQPTVVLLGTSMNEVNLERLLTDAARRAGTPSLAVLDFWSNYVERFGGTSSGTGSVPDTIAVMDTAARAEMIDLGFDPGTLVVTGQPAFDALPSARADFSASDRERVRLDLGASAEHKLVCFASQPLAAMYGEDDAAAGFLGFTEHDVVANLMSALEIISAGLSGLVLAIRPHPRELAASFARFASSRVRIVVTNAVPWPHLAMASDLVVGMSSVLLVEACYLRCPTISLQPGLRWPDPLPTNRIGMSEAVYSADDILPRVADLLMDEKRRAAMLERLATFEVPEDATRNVTELVYALSAAGFASVPKGARGLTEQPPL